MNSGGARVAHVSEVLERLLEEFGNDPSQRSVLFQAALRVCADESQRLKQGLPSASLDVLVERALALLGTPQGKANLEAARGSKATPIYVPLPETPPAEPPGRPEVELVAPQDRVPSRSPSELTQFPEEQSSRVAERSADTRLRSTGSRRSRPTLLLALLGLAAVAALAYFGLQRAGLLGAGSARPGKASPPTQVVGRQPAPGQTTRPFQVAAAVPAPHVPAPAPAAAAASTPAPVGAAAAAPAPPAGYAETMASPDWVGRAPTYVIQLSSYRQRAAAEGQAGVVAKRYGRPAYAVEVTIPGRGLFYRVVLGDFASAADARAYRAQLAPDDTSGVAAIFWIVAP